MTLQRRAGVSLPLFLNLTDGSTTVDLVHGADGFLMESWVSQEAPLKEGGVYRDSPLSDNSSIALAQYANVIEEIVVTQPIHTTKAAANALSKLRRLLRKARDYWNKTGADEIIYLHWQERDEANELYALVVNGRVPETASLLGNVQAARTGVSIFIERQHWVETVPNVGIACAIGTAQEFSDYDPGFGDPLYGNTSYNGITDTYEESLSSAVDTAFVGNHAKLANITDVWQNLNPAGANSWVQVAPFADTPPYNLMTATTHTNTSLYFGINSTLANSGPFSSLVFPYEPIAASSWATDWEYYNGSTWVDLVVWDGTGGISDSGSSSWTADPNGIPKNIVWLQPSNWTTVNLLSLLGGSAPNVTGWWVRCRFTGVVTVAPSMTNELYTISWAHTVIRADSISTGDIDPIVRTVLVSQVGNLGGNILAPNKLWVGSRRLDRGTGFVAFLNAANKQNPVGVEFDGTVVDTPLSHTGQRASWTPGGNSDEFNILSWTLDNTIAPSYTGKFRMFARVGYGGDYAQGDFKFKGVALISLVFVSSTPVVAPAPAAGANKYQLIELGDITIPTDIKGINQIIFQLGIAPVNGSGKTIYVYDIILMPADEWFGYFQGFYTLNKEPVLTGIPTALDIDPLTFPRSGVKAHLEEDVWGSPIFVDGWRVVSSGKPKLQLGRDQQIWFLMDKYDATDTDNPPNSTNSYPEVAASPRIFRQSRFLGSRG